jgi:hypothetical protein
MAVYTSNVEPLPHQITAVYKSMLPCQPHCLCTGEIHAPWPSEHVASVVGEAALGNPKGRDFWPTTPGKQLALTLGDR